MRKESYFIEHNGDCWQSVFPADASHLSQLHETVQDAVEYFRERGILPQDVTILESQNG